jgi:hypothetical protein
MIARPADGWLTPAGATVSVRPREPTLAELVAAAQGYPRPDRALLARAAAGREAIDHGADPELTLALVVWPSGKAQVAETAARS